MVEEDKKQIDSDKSEKEQVEAQTESTEEKVSPKIAKKSFMQTKKGQIIMSAVALLVVIYATFIAESPLEPVLFGLKPSHFLFGISIILSIFVTLVYKYMTDQTLMRELKKDLKKYQKQMKEHRSDATKVSEVSKKSMAVNMKYMHQSMKPMLITMLPFLGIFTWLRSNFAETIMYNLPVWPHTLGWLGTYIIFSMVFTTLFRKILGVV
jgi:uncharacterized membrane protein (DUF106 family)